MKEKLRVSLVQAATHWHDAVANRELYGDLVRPLKGRTDLVVLPETFTSGFTNETLSQAESMDGHSVAWLTALSMEIDADICGSIIISDHGRYVNRLLWMRPDGSHQIYDKKHLFRMANEHQRFQAGEEKLLIDLHGWMVCPMVCYDLRFPVWIRNRFNRVRQNDFDYDVFIVVANWPAARRVAWKTLLRARAIENLSYTVGVNRVGEDGNGLAYAGDSAVIDFLGEPVLELGSQPQVVTVELNRGNLQNHRQRFPANLDADEFVLK